MKRIITLSLAFTLVLNSYSQQKQTTSKTTATAKPTSTTTVAAAVPDTAQERKTSAFLGAVGGLSAAYLLSAQELIDAQVLLYKNKGTTPEEASQKINVQKNIIEIILKQVNDLETSNAVTTESPDYYFVQDLRETLQSLSNETVTGIEYLKKGDPLAKAEFEAKRETATAKIKALLGME